MILLNGASVLRLLRQSLKSNLSPLPPLPGILLRHVGAITDYQCTRNSTTYLEKLLKTFCIKGPCSGSTGL